MSEEVHDGNQKTVKCSCSMDLAQVRKTDTTTTKVFHIKRRLMKFTAVLSSTMAKDYRMYRSCSIGVASYYLIQ